MAFTIPETLVNAKPIEQEAFKLLRKELPDGCYLWHRSALELAHDEAVPFLALNEDAGIMAIFVSDEQIWSPSQQLDGSEWPLAQHASLHDIVHRAEAIARALFQVLIESELPELLDDEGNLKPAFHRILLFCELTAREINRTGLRKLAPDWLMLGKDEVQQLFDIAKGATLPRQRLTPEQFNAIRRCVCPSIQIAFRSRLKSAGAHPPSPAGPSRVPSPTHTAPPLLDLQQERAVKSFADIPEQHLGLTRDLDTRLIRGVAGSGKSLILLHRAHYLLQRNSNWDVLLVTYTRSLADFLHARYADLPPTIARPQITNFHAWAKAQLESAGLWHDVYKDGERIGLLRNIVRRDCADPGYDEARYLIEEFDWIRDNLHLTLDSYLSAERHGRKQRFDTSRRQQVWKLYEDYRRELDRLHKYDWSEVGLRLLNAIESGRVSGQRYHAILVDEAQDFAPLWFKVLQKMLRPSTNALFLVADAAQKIYRRQISWRALGIELTGNRSRVMRRSYRNTFEILKTAHDVVAPVADDLRGDGEEVIKPELNQFEMRRGPLPLLWYHNHSGAEVYRVAQEIRALRQACGYDWGDFAILCRNGDSLNEWARALRQQGMPVQLARGRDLNMSRDEIKLLTLHASKGLEFSVVFICDIDRLQPRPGLDADEMQRQLAEERRLLYVGMTRARDRLYLMHKIPLPGWLRDALSQLQCEG